MGGTYRRKRPVVFRTDLGKCTRQYDQKTRMKQSYTSAFHKNCLPRVQDRQKKKEVDRQQKKKEVKKRSKDKKELV